MRPGPLVLAAILALVGSALVASALVAELSSDIMGGTRGPTSSAVRIGPGAEYEAAQSAGLAGPWNGRGADLHLISGSHVQIDRLVLISNPTGLTLSFVPAQSLPTPVTWLFWTGTTAPVSPRDVAVCAGLDASAAWGACSADRIHGALIVSDVPLRGLDPGINWHLVAA